MPTVLVTAFEPSGDAHAAPLVRALRAQAPDVRVVGWGGPRMREAGCEMAGETARDGAMTLVGLRKILEVRRRCARSARGPRRTPSTSMSRSTAPPPTGTSRRG
ncbi:MAG: hypothetical protein ACKOHI_00170 [Phycisphaerales bacterium]